MRHARISFKLEDREISKKGATLVNNIPTAPLHIGKGEKSLPLQFFKTGYVLL